MKFNTPLRSKSNVEFKNLILKEIHIVFLEKIFPNEMSYFWQFLKRSRILKFNTPLRSKSSVEFKNVILKEIQIVFLEKIFPNLFPDETSYFWQFLKRSRILKFNTPLRSKSSVEFKNVILKEIQIVFLEKIFPNLDSWG